MARVLADVVVEENGFTEIAYTQDEAFSGILSSAEDDAVSRFLHYEDWEQDTVDNILKAHSNHIKKAISATRHHRFKFPTVENAIEDIPSFLPLLQISQLLLLSSLNEAHEYNFDQAIFFAESAVNFSQQIKTEENAWLVSYMIGLTMQHEVLDWVHNLANNFPLETHHYLALTKALEKIPSYHNDTFKQTFAGEYRFSKSLIRAMQNRSLAERWNDWYLNEDWWNLELGDDGEFSQPSAPRRVLAFLQILFPGYFLHFNESAEEAAKVYKRLGDLTDSYCSQTAFLQNIEPAKPNWLDILKPNAMMQDWTSAEANFAEYFVRRCFSDTHIESTKAIVALKHYESVHGLMPDRLEALVPQYLATLPLDAFNGEVLNYSKPKAWLYSVGANFSDDGGSSCGHYVWRCETDDQCKNNPTFVLTAAIDLSDDSRLKPQ